MSIRQPTPRPTFDLDLTRIAMALFGTIATLLLGVALYAIIAQTSIGAVVASVVTITPAFVAATAMGLLLVAVFFAVRRVEPDPGR